MLNSIKTRLAHFLFEPYIGKTGQVDVGTKNELTRQTWLEKTLGEIPEGARLLDAGAGELKYKKFCSHLDYVAQDFGQYNGVGDDKGLHKGTWDQTKLDIVCDIVDIPEPDASFDAIMCIEVLEHLPEPVAALREFARLLKNRGTLILTAPFCSLTHFAPYHFHTGFSRYFYEKWLPELGFQIAEIEFNGNFFEYLAQEIRRISFVRDKYTASPESRFDRLLRTLSQRVMLAWLGELSAQDNGSNELLFFGLHIRAIRQRG